MNRRSLLIVLGGLAIITSCLVYNAKAHAEDQLPPEYPIAVTSVYDGDTFSGIVKIWPGVLATVNVRVAGIDTPEIHGQCLSEIQLAQQARDATVAFLKTGKVTIHEVQADKYYGRVVAEVFVDGKSLNDELLSKNLAKPYDGGTKTPWCPKK